MLRSSFLLVTLLSLLTACQRNNDVAPAGNTPARTAQEAKARLVNRPKWAIDEAIMDGVLLFKRGQTNPQQADIELEWCRFAENGSFEVKSLNDPTIEKLFYRLDEPNNRIVISYDAQFTNVENWTIKAGSVYADKFEMELKDTGETLHLKMISVR